MELKESVAIVTGGAMGIGKAICYSLLKQGAKVTVADIDEDAGKETVSELSLKFNKDNVIYIKCDVTENECFRHVFLKTIGTFGKLDIVCNNAAIADELEWTKCIATNFTSVVQGTELALEFMGKHGGGRGGVVINMSSIGGLYPNSLAPVYFGTKAAVNMYTVCMAAPENYQRHGIRINANCAGFTRTKMYENAKCVTKHPDLLKNLSQENMMNPEEVVEAVMELITDTEKNGAIQQIYNGKIKYITLPELKE